MKEKILSSLDEIKTISDPFRLKILFLFDEDNTPITVKQMAVKLEEVPSKVHYHVKELERVGVLEIVHTKERAGIVEKFYLPTADVFKVERNIGNSNYEDEHMQVGENLFLAMQQDFTSNNKLKKPGENASLNYGLYHMTEEENEQLKGIIKEFLENKEQREGTKPYMFGYALFRKYEKKGFVEDGD
jgi:DNA-binding transcriptional regulator GbsR (MarR family)